MSKNNHQKRFFTTAVILIAVLFLIFIGLFVREVYFTCAQKSEAESADKQVFIIEKGQGFREVASALQKNGLIKSRFWFDFYVLANGKYRKLQAGAYEFSGEATIAKIVQKISRGDILEEKITILEGWNSHDIANYLQQKQIFSQDDFLAAVKSESFLTFDFFVGNSRVVGLEGFLFPDTYEFAFGSSISDVLQEILANFKMKIDDELRNEIKRQGKSLYDILIMASLLEKEVRTYADKQVVAGILWKRLDNNWPLQVDVAPDTYQNKGLPPGPICNPGLESIKAAVYYKESPYWYYLSARDGRTIFSATFEQHKAAKAKYLR